MTEGDAIRTPAPPVAAVPATRTRREILLRRTFSAVTLWTVLLLVLLSGQPPGYFLLCAGMGLGGLWEFYAMLDHKRLPVFRLYGMTCALIFFVASFYVLQYRQSPVYSENFEVAVLLLFLLGVFGRQLFTRASENIPPLETMAYTVFGLMYVPWLFNFILKIVYLVPHTPASGLQGQYYVLYLIAVSKFSDMGAYLTGSLFGRHKMVPHISPGKTWEGFGGALAFSLLISYGLRALMPMKLALLRPVDLLALGLGLGVAAVIGDLAESILKRGTGVKDSGKLLPGIGGMLDLIDSLLFTAPLMFFYLRWCVLRG